MRFVRILLPIALGFLLVPLALPGSASAHERRTIGQYEVVVGFIGEPAILDQPNGVDFTVTESARSSRH